MPDRTLVATPDPDEPKPAWSQPWTCTASFGPRSVTATSGGAVYGFVYGARPSSTSAPAAPLDPTAVWPGVVEPNYPAQPDGPLPSQMPAKMDHHQRNQLRAAASRAVRLYPGPVGELVSRELLDIEIFGYRFDQHGMAAALVKHVMGLDAA